MRFLNPSFTSISSVNSRSPLSDNQDSIPDLGDGSKRMVKNCGEGGGPRRPQCKMKSYFMERFFNEPVEALDKKLESVKSNLNSLPMDPFAKVRQEELEEQEEGEHPLDYSMVQVASPPCPHHLAAHSCSSKHSLPHLPPTASSSLVQRVIIQTSSSSNPAGWGVSLQSLRPSGSLHPSTMQQESPPDISSSPLKDTPTSSGQPDLLVATTKHSRPPLPPLYVFIRYHFLFTTYVSIWIERIMDIYPCLQGSEGM